MERVKLGSSQKNNSMGGGEMKQQSGGNTRLVEELNLVIQTDREAVEMVQKAYKTKQSVEKKTAAERLEILQEAEEMRCVLEQRVADEQKAEIKARQEQARCDCDSARVALREEMQTNKESWVEEMYSSILRPPRE